MLTMTDLKKKNEPGYSISYKIACAPSEDSDQTARMRSLIRGFAGHSRVAKELKRLQADSKESDQTAWMHVLF